MDKMPTPMSQASAAKRVITPADAIIAIGRGNPKASELAGLSDLTRRDATILADVWPAFPEERRVAVLRQLDELAESNVTLLFGRVYRIALADESAVVRQLAIAGLWEDTGSDLIETFLTLLQHDPSTDVRAEAATALGRFAELAALGELGESSARRIESALFEAARSDEQPELVKRKSLEHATVFGRKDEAEALILEAYDSDDSAVRASAVYAMGRSLDRRWLRTVIAELESDDAELRYEAARASGELGHADAIPGLSELVLDTDVEVRTAATIALGKIGGPGAIRVLRALLQSEEPADREAIEDAIAEAELMSDGPRTQP